MHVERDFNAKNINICNIFLIFEMQDRLKYFKNFPPEYRLCFRKMKKNHIFGKTNNKEKMKIRIYFENMI